MPGARGAAILDATSGRRTVQKVRIARRRSSALNTRRMIWSMQKTSGAATLVATSRRRTAWQSVMNRAAAGVREDTNRQARTPPTVGSETSLASKRAHTLVAVKAQEGVVLPTLSGTAEAVRYGCWLYGVVRFVTTACFVLCERRFECESRHDTSCGAWLVVCHHDKMWRCDGSFFPLSPFSSILPHDSRVLTRTAATAYPTFVAAHFYFVCPPFYFFWVPIQTNHRRKKEETPDRGRAENSMRQVLARC